MKLFRLYQLSLSLFPEDRRGKYNMGSALLSPPCPLRYLPGGDHSRHPRLVELRLAVQEVVRLIHGDSDAFLDLPVQAGPEGPLHLVGER